MNNKMRVLIACEESQTVCKSFRKLGHQAYSCDILPCSGGHPEWHLQTDVTQLLNQNWDLIIAHPPCTFIAGSSVQWLSHPEDKFLPFDQRRSHPFYPNRRRDMQESIEFIKKIYNSKCKHIAIENPVGLLSSKFRKPDQIIQPYMFGDEATKTTCLWLKGLPKLKPTKIVGKGERVKFSSGKSHPLWYSKGIKMPKEERQKFRSKTFEGIATAMAEQWGCNK